jgi:hypothetical protein
MAPAPITAILSNIYFSFPVSKSFQPITGKENCRAFPTIDGVSTWSDHQGTPSSALEQSAPETTKDSFLSNIQ